MTAPLNYQPPASATHYRPSSSLHLPRFLLFLPAACLTAAAGAFLYVYLLHRFSAVPYRIASARCAAIATALLGIVVIHFAQVRTRLPACLAGAAISLFALYAMWIAWIHQLLASASITYSRLLLHPIDFARIIWTIHDVGVWSWHDHTISGLPLLLVWLIEAAMVLAAGIFFPSRSLYTDVPLCRDCNKPCTPVPDLPRFAADRQDDLLASIDARDFASLATHDSPHNYYAPELVLRLYTCRHCLTTHILTVSRLYWHFTSHGHATIRTTPLINQLLLTPSDALLLGTTCAQILATRTPSPSTAESELENT